MTPEPVSSEDEDTKAGRLDMLVVNAPTNKFHKFHPMDLYIYFHFGTASVGGGDRPYFLESPGAIQKTVKADEYSNREELRKRNDKEVVEKTQTKKGRRLIVNTVDEMEECDPTTSFAEVYGKQLELEEVRVETERLCE